MKKANIGFTETEFHNLLEAWSHTLLSHEKELYGLYKNKCCELSVSFPLRVGEVSTMEIRCINLVSDKTDLSVLIKNIEKEGMQK